MLQERLLIGKEAVKMAQIVGSAESEDLTNVTQTTGRVSLTQTCKMLGKGYFVITLIGILSFTLLFFILWFM